MSKSNWEIWAEREQPLKLQSTATLEGAARLIKDNQGILSSLVLRGMELMVQSLFGVTDMELNRLLAGEEYWM